jgi:DNA-binding protein HU-beta
VHKIELGFQSTKQKKGINMTKAEFVAKVAGKTHKTHKDVEEVLNGVLAQITEELAGGNEVPFIGFGSFKVSTRAARTGRNPSTGAELKIPETKAVSFKVGAKLKEAVAGKKVAPAKKK